jgi:hypothetical protein
MWNTCLMKDAAVIRRNVSGVQKEAFLHCRNENMSEIAQT